MNLETDEKSQIKKIALEKEENLAEDFFTGVLSSVILGSVKTVRSINTNTDIQPQQNNNTNQNFMNMQENHINTQGLDNSSFSYDDNAKRYSDLKLTSKINYFKSNDANLKIAMLDSKGKLINELTLISDKDAIKDLKKSEITIFNSYTIKNGNIPINKDLLNKYSNVKEIFENERNNFDGKVELSKEIKELDNVDLNNVKISNLKKLATDIFSQYNSKNVFNNNGNKITVNKTGINESIEKIYNNESQRNLIKEHLQVFSDLGNIIEHATLVNQTPELKNRSNIKLWNYYFDGLKINGDLYHLEFDVRSMDNGENQYRVQRLEKSTQKTGDHDGDASNNTRILPPYGQPVSTNNVSTTNQQSQIVPLSGCSKLDVRK